MKLPNSLPEGITNFSIDSDGRFYISVWNGEIEIDTPNADTLISLANFLNELFELNKNKESGNTVLAKPL